MKGRIAAPMSVAPDSEKLGGISAEEYEKLLSLGASRILFGTANMYVNSNDSGSIEVTFQTKMDRAPNAVVATILSSSPLERGVGVNNLTATGFNAYFQNKTSSGGDMWAYWIAVWM